MRPPTTQRHSLRVQRFAIALLCLSAILLTVVGAIAQSQPGSTPALTESAAEVNKSGYLLKPTGLSIGAWPNVQLDFSIERSDRTTFRNLKLADVQPKLDGLVIPTKEGDLKLKDSQGASVLLLLDGSGSMSIGIDKLRAAKQSLIALINSLEPQDKIGLVVFDEEPRTIIPITSDKEQIKKEIENFTIRKEKSRFTRLYDAVDFGLKVARQNNVKNLLLISDGWEDTPETRELLKKPAPDELEKYKRQREQSITEFSRSNDIRVFTVAIGDENGQGLNYVDREALANISKGANGGIPVYIELTSASGDDAFKQEFLLSRLQQTLDDFRKSFRYSYSLDLDLGALRPNDSKDHKLWIGFTVGDDPRVQLPVEYTYAWTGKGVVVKGADVKQAIFISSAPRTVKWQHLLLIYLPLLFVLLVMATLPAVGRLLVGGGQTRKLQRAIVVVGRQSPLLGSVCPNEGTAAGRQYLIKEGDVVLVCPNPDCKTPHHLSCWRFNEHHCMKRICTMEMVVPPNLLEKYGLMEREAS